MKRVKYLFATLLFMIMAIPAMAATTINVKVDMTVLWGNDLPEKVYMFAFLNTKTGNYYNKVPNLSITANYNPSLEGTSIDQDVTGALALTDSDSDGIYEGTISYSGSSDIAFHTRLFISKDDPNNAVHFPKYEDKTGATETDIIDTQNFRTITIASGQAKVGWDPSKADLSGNVWNTAWENKTISQFYVTTPITIWKDLSANISVNAGFNNAKADLRRDVTKYVSITSADSYKVQVVKGSAGTSLVGKAVTASLVAVTAERNGKTGVMYVEVKLPPTTEAFQTIVMTPEGGVNSGENCTVGGVSDYDNKSVKGANLVTIYDTLNFKSDTFGFALFTRMGTSNWQATQQRNGVMIPIKKQMNTAVYNVSFVRQDGTTGVIATVPVSIPSMTMTNTGSKAMLRWAEDIAKYGSTYTKEEILVRVSRIDAEPVSLRYDIYNASNPIKLGYGTTGEENIKAFNNKSVSYVDFLFTAGVSETKIAADGKTVQYRLSNTDKSVSFSNFQPDKYKVQIYTLKQGNKYAVTTFEKEYPFEITAENSLYNENEENYYLINEVSSKEFRTIKVGVTTKTTEPIDLTLNNIYYNGTQALVGEKRNSTGVFDSGKPTAKAIKVEEDTSYRGVKPPLDVILCLDSSNSMSDKMAYVKAAWSQFENDMSIRGYDVKYKLIRFGGEKYNSSFEIQSGWTNSINSDKFYTDSADNGWTREKSDTAIMEALNKFDSEGRYLGVDANGNWTITQNSSNGSPSAKVVIFVTDANASNNPTPDILEYAIRTRNVVVSGLGGVKKDGLMLEDDYVSPYTGQRIPADYPVGYDQYNEQHYYHLKLLLGNRFKFYQITKNSDTILAQLKQGMGRVSVVKRWLVTYVTPNGYRDGTERSAEFNIFANGKEVVYGGEAKDRTYLAPYMQTTTDPEDQTLIFQFRDITKTRLTQATYKIDDNFALGNSYRRMKAIDIASGKGLNDIEANFDYSGDRNFVIDPDNKSEAGINYGDVWTYPGDTTKSGLMIGKVSGVGDGTLNKATTDLTDAEINDNLPEQIFNYGYNSKIQQARVTEDGDNVTVTWEKGDVTTAIPFNNQRYMFRLMREEADWYYSPYDKITNDSATKGSRPINYMDSITPITLPNGDTTTQANQKMDTFLRDGGYVDFIFGEDKLESTTALGVRIDYSAGKLNIVGLPKRPDGKKYRLKIYSLKDGTATIKDRNGAVREAADFKVITYNQDIIFSSGNPAIVDIPIGKDGIFRIDYIDTTKFTTVDVHFSTKMPYEIKKPEITNLFKNNAEILQTGTITRVSESQYDNSVTEKAVISGLSVAESDLRGYKLPLDIVFCIDNSGSMANEIAAVKNGLKQFGKTLTSRGFDVKYNLITFGPNQKDMVGGKLVHGAFPGYQYLYEPGVSSPYMVQFKPKWFDGTDAVNKTPTNADAGVQPDDSAEEIAFKKQQYIEVDELVKAFDGVNSTGGYYKLQENSVWAFDKAKTLLSTNGRYVDYKGNIITAEQASSTPTTMKSLKWIIFLTDEGIDNDTAPSGYSKKVSGVVPKTTVGSNKIPTVIKEMGDNLNQNGIYLTGIHHIGTGLTDKRGIAGVKSDDTDDGVIYNQYAVVMGDKYNGYEMGSNGEQTTNALLDSVSNIGIIQRWKLSYSTPFDKADGTFRQVNFVPANLIGTTTTAKITPKDVNPVAAADSDVGGRTIVSTRKYKAPDIEVQVEITSPVTDGQFTFVSGDSTKILVEGKARAREKVKKIVGTTEVTTYNYAAMQNAMITISNNSNGNSIYAKEYTFRQGNANAGIGDELEDGWYRFYIEVPVQTLASSGAELFNINVSAVKSGATGEKDVYRVSLDSGPPKITSITVKNSNAAQLWGNIYKTEKFSQQEKIFTTDEINKFSTAWYQLENSFKYNWSTVRNLTLSSTERNIDYDGYFAKQGDNLIVTVEFLEENFNTASSELNMSSTKNVLKARFAGFGVNGADKFINGVIVGSPQEVEIGGIKGKQYTAEFRLTVENSTADIVGTVAFDVRDNLARASSERLGDIQITKIDNQRPGTGSISDILDSSTNNSITLTKNPYIVKANSDASADANGFRVFKVYYNYDDTKSDFGAGGRNLVTGNHDNDGSDGSKYFYIKAGDGKNNIAGLTTIEGTSAVKTPNIGSHGDDGKYIFRRNILLIDKAGNISSADSTDGRILHIDTQAPRIAANSIVLKKLKDKDSLNFTYADNLVRNGDTAQIQYSTVDYNISNSVLNYQKAYSTYVMPEYSKLMATGIATNPVVSVGNVSGNSEEIKGINVYAGDINGAGATDILGSAVNPALIIGSSVTENVPISVYAKDAAGNEIEVSKYVTVDNTPPAKPVISSYAWESSKTEIPNRVYLTAASTKPKERDNNNDPTISAPHFTEGGSERNFFVRLDNLASDVTFAKTTLNNSVGNDVKLGNGGLNGKGNGNKFYEIAQLTDVLPNENGQNFVKVAVRDGAGNISEDSEYSLIIMDRMVGNRNTVKTILGGTAQIASGNNYGFRFNIKDIPEFSGLQKMVITRLVGTNTSSTVNGEINIGQDLSITENAVNSSAAISLPVPAAMQGTRIRVMTVIYDNLGNSSPFSWEFLIPKRSSSSGQNLEIKSQSTKSEKEIRTKVKVVGQDNFDLEQTEETGKNGQ